MSSGRRVLKLACRKSSARHTEGVTRMARILCLIGVVAVVAGGHAWAQARSNAVRSATEVVSPVAVASWMTTPGSDRIELLVLWRGEAGWFLGRGQRRSSSSGRTANGFTSTATFGEVT